MLPFEKKITVAGAVMRMDWEVRLPRKLITSWVNHQRPNGGPVMHFGRNLKRDLLQIELSVDPPPVVSPTLFEYQTASVTRAEVKFSGLATSHRAQRREK